MHGRSDDQVWKALADPTRRRILDLLSVRARTTGELAESFPRLSRFAVMKHLGVLERAGVIVPRREGRVRWNHLNAVPLRRVFEKWVGGHSELLAAGMLELQRQVESKAPRTVRGDEHR